MRSPAALLLTAVMLAVPAMASAQSRHDRLAERLGETIETDTVDTDGSVEWGQAVGVVDASPETVMRIVTDYARYEDFLPHFRRSRVLSRRGQNALVYMQATVARDTVQLWAQMRLFARRPRGDTQIIEGRMTEGNMDTFAARWEVTPIADGRKSLVRFRIIVDPGLPLPSSLFTSENVKAARRTISALRDRVSEPRYTVARNP